MTANPFSEIAKNVHKIPVTVTVEFAADGSITPISFRTEEGVFVTIDRVLNSVKAPALKAGGQGICHTIRVCYHDRSIIRKLFHGSDDKWFIERD